MKKISHFVALVLIATLTAMQTVSCTTRRGPVNHAFDGKTLFQGLLFRTGPAARQVPELWELLGSAPRPSPDRAPDTLRNSARQLMTAGESKAAAALNTVADTVSDRPLPPGAPTDPTSQETINYAITGIEARDATFFSRFAENVQSGDAVRVDRAMTEASRHTIDVLSDGLNSGDRALAIGVWYYWDVVVAIEVAAVVLIALLAVFPLLTTNDSDLLHEDVVAIVTRRFHMEIPTQAVP